MATTRFLNVPPGMVPLREPDALPVGVSVAEYAHMRAQEYAAQKSAEAAKATGLPESAAG